MFEQDVLMRELMQFVQLVLQKVAGWLNIGQIGEAHRATDSVSEKALNLIPEYLLKIKESELLNFIQGKEWNEIQIQLAAEILLTKAKISLAEKDAKLASEYCSRSKILFVHLMDHGKEFSLEWESKLQEIELLLK